MFRLAILLLFGISANALRFTIDRYDIIIENHILKSVTNIGNSSTFLDLSHVAFHYIAEGAFKNGIPLKKLSLEHNDLRYLPIFAFRSLRNLEHLSLANNLLEMSPFVFGGLKNLKMLDIRNNRIKKFTTGSFYGLENVKNILHDENESAVVRPKYFSSPFKFFSLCMNNRVVKSVEIHDENNDEIDDEECVKKIRPYRDNSIDLSGEGITGFQRGWYRVHGPIINSLDLSFNEIAEITSEILDDLPKELTRVNMANNYITVLKNHSIDNRYLRELNLKSNIIRTIEKLSLANTTNLDIILASNSQPPAKLIEDILHTVDILSIPGTSKPERYIVNAAPPIPLAPLKNYEN